ncbi:hypothetical protein ACFSUK_24465 [Sphingobium scionense]
MRAPSAELLVLLLAYAFILWLFATGISTHGLPAWTIVGQGRLSAAGWWHMLVSLPILLMLLMGWLWRILLWTRLLHKVAAMDLRLIVAHPDNAGGLGFLAQSVRAFGTFALGIGCITAGRFANVHLQGAATPMTGGFLIGGTVVLVLLLCVAPLGVFRPVMARAWRRNAMHYGALAVALGTGRSRTVGSTARRTSSPTFFPHPTFRRQPTSMAWCPTSMRCASCRSTCAAC